MISLVRKPNSALWLIVATGRKFTMIKTNCINNQDKAGLVGILHNITTCTLQKDFLIKACVPSKMFRL